MSLSFDSTSLAKPIVCAIVAGLRIASSLLISGVSLEIKQLSKALGARP